ncbi:MAG: adenine specific DNA methyltransferase [Anaerolineaceae bacterium]|nr:MAG: adenine specific DNA methyltransferase [Anaerolineaceae bacterium]
MTASAFQEYLSKIEADYRRGIATEHTYRSALETLIETLAPGVDASNDPRHIACGAPDFVVERRKIPLGYVETKDVGADLDKIEKTDQLKRYFKALNNLILTDYLEFRWYVRGELRLKARIAHVGADLRVRPDLRLRPDEQGIALAGQMFAQFFQTETPTVTSAKELASRMAEQTHLIRDLIIKSLTPDPSPNNGRGEQSPLARQYKTFCDYLLPALKPEEFADLYAQTMAYGLFAAKLSAPENAPFNRAAAYQYLTANKFLRRLFLDVGEELDGTLIAPFLDDIAALLAHADLAQIQTDLFKRTRSEDPVVHFYETFLSVYDPKLRASRGVYYTPEPVVQFIVHSVDWILKNRFGRTWGLADQNVKILDPATGTATFLYYVIQAIHEEVTRRGQAGTWSEKSKELLRRVFGFELLMAPYVVSHLKLGLLMQGLGAPLSPNERLQVYLTNTLEEGTTRAETIEGLGYYIAEEASQAAHVKKQEDIMVVLGNPPYSGLSANSSVGVDGKPNFIGRLLNEYYLVDGRPLGEKKLWLQDDYVKFIRFGEWRIDKTGHGILAFITNHGYLDNPTFRGMRQHLMQTFDEIYVLDLHGNSKKKERTPEGGKDENVFDIQQGVAILLAIKNPVGAGLVPAQAGRPQGSPLPATVHHASLWGLRAEKYAFLQASDVAQVAWTELQPSEPYYFYIPQNQANREEYEKGWQITEIMPVNVTGIVTARDGFVLDFESQPLIERMKVFVDESFTDEDIKRRFELQENYAWRVSDARKQLRKELTASPSHQYKIKEFLYRPFDQRKIYYHPSVVWRTRSNVMPNMIAGKNLGLITTRQTRDAWGAFVTENICGHKAYAAYDINSLFPLYLYTTPEETAGTLFAQSEVTRKANLAPAFVKAMEEKLGMKFVEAGSDVTVTSQVTVTSRTFTPEDVFHYAYAVFHSPTYRSRYAEFLKIDFPRLPLTSDKKLFAKLVAKGAELVSLHLLKSPKMDDFITSYPAAGNNVVEKVVFTSDPKGLQRPLGSHGRVWINAAQYFGGVPEAVWEFKVGGYQVCEKWLKDRKGRTLSGEDITHYQRVVVALKETIRLMKEIDKTIPKWPLE